MQYPFILEEDCVSKAGCERIQLAMVRFLESSRMKVFNVEVQSYALMNAIKKSLRNKKLQPGLEKLFHRQDGRQLCEFVHANLVRMKAAVFLNQSDGREVMLRYPEEAPVYLATRADYVSYRLRRVGGLGENAPEKDAGAKKEL